MNKKIIDAHVNGIVHKEVINGTTYYRLDGKLHCDFGPAVIYKNGIRCWYYHGVYHRIGGPAVEYPNGDEQYWLFGKQFSKEEYYRRINPVAEAEAEETTQTMNINDSESLFEDEAEEQIDEKPSYTNPKIDKSPEHSRRKLTISQIESLLGYRIRLVSN